MSLLYTKTLSGNFIVYAAATKRFKVSFGGLTALSLALLFVFRFLPAAITAVVIINFLWLLVVVIDLVGLSLTRSAAALSQKRIIYKNGSGGPEVWIERTLT